MKFMERSPGEFDSSLTRRPNEPYARYVIDAPTPLPRGIEEITQEMIDAVIDRAKTLSEISEPEV